MKKQFIWPTEAAVEITIQPRRRAFHSYLNLIKPSARHDQTRIIVSARPRRPACLTRRALPAALCEAELAEWKSGGGDCMASMHQPID